MDINMQRLVSEHGELRQALVGLVGTDDPKELGEMARCLPLLAVDQPDKKVMLQAVQTLNKIKARTAEVNMPGISQAAESLG